MKITIDEIKQLLREKGLPLSGNKQELLDRLIRQSGGGKSSDVLWAEHHIKLRELLKRDRTFSDNVDELTHLPTAFKTTGKYKKYLQWMVESYLEGGIQRYEDIASRAYPAFDDYMLLHKKGILQPDEKDINKYCGIAGCKGKQRKGKAPTEDKKGLEQLLDNYADKLDELKSITKSMMHVEPVYSDDKVNIYHPKSQEEAIHLGQGTRWCTASKLSHNMFSNYDDIGPLYIIVPKKPEYPGKKYQIHQISAQYMNEKDEEIELSTLITKFPQITKLVADRIDTGHNVYWELSTIEITRYEVDEYGYEYEAEQGNMIVNLVIDDQNNIYHSILDVPKDYLIAKTSIIYQDESLTIASGDDFYLLNEKIIISRGVMKGFYDNARIGDISNKMLKMIIGLIGKLPSNGYQLTELIELALGNYQSRFKKALPMDAFKYAINKGYVLSLNHQHGYKLDLMLATPEQIYYYLTRISGSGPISPDDTEHISEIIRTRPELDRDRLISIFGKKMKV